MFQPYLQWVFQKRNLLAITFMAAQTIVFPIEGTITGKEAITLRRVIEFWKDGDYEIAKKQIHQFLEHFPNSEAKDHLCLMLGDLYFQEKNYQKAYSTYERICSEELADQSLFSRLYSLSQLQDYRGVIELSDLYFKKDRDQQEQLQVHYLTADALVRVAITSDVESKKQWTEKASFHAKYLEKTSYADDFHFAFAELQKMVQNYPLAIQTYFLLADKHPEKKEELLFEAGTTQLFIDKPAALKTFKTIISLKGKSAQAAVFNYLSLLLEAEKYEEFLQAYQEYQDQIPETKSALIQFYIGKSYFALNQFDEAKKPLLKFMQEISDKERELKPTLIYLTHCAQATSDLPLLSHVITQMKNFFPTDLDLAKSLLIRAKLSIDAKECEAACRDIEEILNTFPTFGNQESLLYTSAFLLFQEQKWRESQALFVNFLEKYPESSKINFVYKHLINSAIKLENKELAISYLSLLLDHQVKQEEKQETQFLLIKMLYETYQYEKALCQLDKYINEFAGAANLYEAHLLSANCHYSLQSRPEFFIFHAEKILSLKPDLLQKNLLHLHLFNAYTLLGNCENQAADHLYTALLNGNMTIKWENQLWLTHFYLAKSIDNQENYERTKYLVNKALSSTCDPLSLETLLLQYADLLTCKGITEEKIDILTALVKRQTTEKFIDWQYERRTLLELAKAYEKTQEIKKALTIYNDLIDSSTYSPSYTGMAALLHRSRILISELPLQERVRDNVAFLNILNDLKELQIRKNIQSEPIHLEAALDYALWRSGILLDPEQKERYAFLLNRIKEDFTSEEDIISKVYLATRHQFQEKEELFQTYISYLNAQIMKVNGEGNKAKIAMQTLLSQPHLHPYLRDRIQTELNSYE